jgi:ion transport protein/cyclic nucleotide-binding protein
VIIREQSGFRLCWDAMILILVLASCILVPYQLAFVHSTPAVHNGLMFAISLVFLVDIGLNFITSYRLAGSEVLDTKAIRRHYLQTHFGVDLIANLPLGMLLWLAGDPQWGPFSAVLWVRLLTLLRLSRFFVILRRWEALSWTHPGYLRVFKYMGIILVITHCIACLWFALAYVDGFPADSWVIAAGIESTDPVSQYVRSLYWTITTMTTVGYGDISPGRTAEYVLAMVIMLMGASLYAFVIGGVASLLSNLQAARNSHWEHMETVEQYLRARRIPVHLTNKVHNYYEYLWERHKGLNEQGLLRDLPESLRLDIMLHLARDVLAKVPLFQHSAPPLRDALLMALTPATYAPGNAIVREGDSGDSIVFITSGEGEIIAGEDETSHGTLGPGDYFGYLSLTLQEQRSGGVRARDYCEVLILDKADYERISAEYPAFREVMKTISAEQSEMASKLLLAGVVL